MGEHAGPSQDHAPALIHPSPLDPRGTKYVVLNSGHTFHEAEFSTLNYLLFPRLGDWGLLQIDPRYADEATPLPAGVVHDSVEAAGLFDEQWRFQPESENQPVGGK